MSPASHEPSVASRTEEETVVHWPMVAVGGGVALLSLAVLIGALVFVFGPKATPQKAEPVAPRPMPPTHDAFKLPTAAPIVTPVIELRDTVVAAVPPARPVLETRVT